MNTLDTIPGTHRSATSMLQKAVQDQGQNAHFIANATAVDSREAVSALVDSRQQLLYTQAATRIISTTDAMTKSLLDIHA